jgi:hypothetical protein
LIAQELAEHWPTAVFVSLRPETFHLSVRSGVLSGYHAKAFTISPPRVDRVLDKRLQFAVELCNGSIPIPSLTGVTHVNLSSLEALIQLFLVSLRRDDVLGEFIDNICGGNVRLALELVRGFFGSGHANTRKMIDIYHETGSYYVPLHEFERAVIYGDAEYYDPDRSPVANLFDLSRVDPKEHFLLPLVIEQVSAARSGSSQEGFVDMAVVYGRLQGLGFVPEQIDAALSRGYRHKLLETTARQAPVSGQDVPRSFRTTAGGLYHTRRLCGQFAYIDAIIVDTPCLERGQRFRDATTIVDRLMRAESFRLYLDRQWNSLGQRDLLFDWPAASAKLQQDIGYVRWRLDR